MKFETVKDLDDEKFRRLTGVKRATFDKMVGILNQSLKTRKTTSGRKRKLSLENSLMQRKDPLKDQKKAKAFLLREKEKAHHKDSGGDR
jgi:hypothetical protein